MADITIRQGETLSFRVEVDDESAESARFIVADPDDQDSSVIELTATFSTVLGKRVADFSTNDTQIEEVEYNAQLIITYENGDIEKYPTGLDCDDDSCKFIILKVCDALDMEVS